MEQKHTATFLARRFDEIGIRPDTRLGQNFLIDYNLQQLLVSAAQLEPRDVVLEVGTGTGALTALMAPSVAAVVTVEVNRHLAELAGEELLGHSNVTLLTLDALANKNRMDARVLAAVAEQVVAGPGRRWKLVANLPFNIATPILSNLLAIHSPPVTMTVTIQKELADRIVAQPSTKDYSALSLWLQSQCLTSVVRVLPPSVFWPRPKVTSAIIQIIVDPQKRERIADLEYWHHFVRAMFLHRRKFLRSVLLGAFKRHLSKADVDSLLRQRELEANTRAEQLDVPAMLALCDAVRARAPEWRL